MTQLAVEITVQRTSHHIDENLLRTAIERILNDEGISAAKISLAIVSDPEIHRVNREFLGHDYPTDVISFLLSDSIAMTESGCLAVSEREDPSPHLSPQGRGEELDDPSHHFSSEGRGDGQGECLREESLSEQNDVNDISPEINPTRSADDFMEIPREIQGELIVSIETAAREAPAHGWSPRAELLLYVVHGMLHLCGYDDLTDEARPVMRSRERELLALWGYCPTGLEM